MDNFVPGSDKDLEEVRPENGIFILPSHAITPAGMTYLVFRKTPPATISGAGNVEYLRPFAGTSPFTAQCADANGNGPQSLYLVPVPIKRSIPIDPLYVGPPNPDPWYLVESIYAKALPGQKMNLRLEDKYLISYGPGGVILNGYAWTIPDKIFKNYTPDSNHSNYLPFPDTEKNGDREVHFYWADSGEKESTVVFNIILNGTQAGAVTSKAKINVEKVESVFTIRPGSDQIAPSPGFPNEKVFGYFGLNKSTPGIQYITPATTPSGFPIGKWNWVQLIKSQRKFTNQTGTHTSLGDGTTLKLDTAFPYWPKGTNAFAADGISHDSGEDTPQEPTIGRTQIEVHESFETYLLFKSVETDSRYVSLQKATWQWGGVVSSADGWQNVTPSEGRADASGAEFTDHPQWNSNTSGDTEH